MVEAELLTRGWHLTKDGIERCKEGAATVSVDALTRKALDIDLKQIGSNALPPDIGKSKSDKVQGPYVLQIQKIRNIAAPKSNEDSSVAPRLLRLQLTDGHVTCVGVVIETIHQIDLNTPPGTKVLLKGRVDVTNGFIILTPATVKVLGGRVEEMVERWELARQLAHHTRTTQVEGAPPPWVPFGQRHRVQHSAESRQRTEGPGKKRTLNLEKNREQTDQDREFEEQRKAAIKELDQARGQQGGKKFGGTGSKGQDGGGEAKENYGGRSTQSERRGVRGGEGRLTDSNRNNQPQTVYRELSVDKKVDEKSVSQLIGMGFSRDAAIAALKKHSGNLDAAIDSLVTPSGTGGGTSGMGTKSGWSSSSSGPPQRGRDRQERGTGGGFKGRRGRRGGDGDDDDEAPSQPSAPTTLFDFLESKLGPSKAEAFKPKENEVQEQRERSERPSRYDRDQAKSGREAGGSYNHNVRETPPRFQKLQAQKQAQRQAQQQGEGSMGPRDNRGNRRDKQDRYDRDERRRDGRRNNEWTNNKEDTSQGYRGDGNYKNERRDGERYQDRNEKRFDGQSRGSRGDAYQNDRSYQGRGNKSDRYQTDKSSQGLGRSDGRSENQGRNFNNDVFSNSSNHQSRNYKRYENQDKPNRFSAKNEGSSEKTYRLMERKPDSKQGQDGDQFGRKSNGREEGNDRGNNWKGPDQERHSGNSQMFKGEFEGFSQSQPFVPQQQSQLQTAAHDRGRQMGNSTGQVLNQQPSGQSKTMANGPEIIPQSTVPPVMPFKEGDHCFAKYWEDNEFYKAQISGIHPSGKTCVVKFVEYGNYEEVFITDIMPTPDQPWTEPPPPIASVHQQQPFLQAAPPFPQAFQQAQAPQMVPGQAAMSPHPDYGNFEVPVNMTLEFRKGGDGPFINRQAQDQGGFRIERRDQGGYRMERRNQRPAQNFYQPPPRR
ncbi:tudor domain-containing protein 3-like [Diadema antillarum]|uniref:tudor domain-containing protein 3-like n=1 Tax=Diadema antillarum TaxID=105358 RepID=UPI003A893C01